MAVTKKEEPQKSADMKGNAPQQQRKNLRRGTRRDTTRPNHDSNKFKGECEGMEGHIFDASTVASADTYTKTRKKLISYVAENFKQPQYIINSIEAETPHTFTTPATPLPIPPATAVNNTQLEVHKRRIDL